MRLTKNTNTHPWHRSYDKDVPYTLEYPEGSLINVLENTVRRYSDQPFIYFNNTTLTFLEMDIFSDRLANRLVELGLQPGERVGLIMPNIPQFIIGFFSILKSSGVVVAINPQYTSSEIKNLIIDAGVQIVIVTNELVEKIVEIQSENPIRSMIITTPNDFNATIQPKINRNDSPSIGQTKGRYLFKELIKHPIDNRPRRSVCKEDPAIFQYSGGTTGKSKAAIGTHGNLVANALQTKAWLTNCSEGQERVLMAIPLFHVYGMVFGMIYAIASAASLILIENGRDIEEILQSIQKFHPTIFPGVPTIYTSIINHKDVIAGKIDLSSIKACISGSAPLLRETKEIFEKISGGKLREGYGLSEAPTATHCNPIMGENRTGSIGLPYPDVLAKIVDIDEGTIEMPTGEAGELIIHGPQVMLGYHNMPDETAIALRMMPDGSGPWLYTGDIARMDADGYFYIIDRKKEVIKPGGLQVWPGEVEKVIASHPDVAEVGVTGIPDPHHGESVKAWVVLKQGRKCEVENIQNWCRDRLAPYKIPTQIDFIEKLPRSTVGKVLRRELKNSHKDSP